MDKNILSKMRLLCDEFVYWQEEDGSQSKTRNPYLQPEYGPYFRNMEIPYIGRSLYLFWQITGETKYKIAADKYMLFFARWVCENVTKYRVAYNYGVGLEAAAIFAKFNPLDGSRVKEYISLMLNWLRQLIDDRYGSHFLCGYNCGREDVIDVGYSEDLCHVGRGLCRLYEIQKNDELLDDMVKLARYFVTDVKKLAIEGIWNPEMGTWSVSPWPITGAENSPEDVLNEVGWVFSAYGDAEFLLDFSRHFKDENLKSDIYTRCLRSVRWIFEACAFENGAVGVMGRDDEWVGLSAAAILGVLKLYDFNLLKPENLQFFKPYVARSWKYVLDHTGENLPVAGYIKVTGKSSPIPGDNVAWVLSWIVECLSRYETIEKIIKG